MLPGESAPHEQEIRGIVTDDPLLGFPVGTSIDLEPVVFSGADSTPIPQGTINWTFFEGALLAVVVSTPEDHVVLGTAVVIAPGLAITATHVFNERIPDILCGAVSIACVGPTSTGVEFWRVRTINTCPSDDIAYLSIQLASPISASWRFRSIALTTRAPKPGEMVYVIGFQFPNVFSDSQFSVRMTGNLYVASGKVGSVYYPMRDSVLMPFPAIEIMCGSLGGMSGGAVLDAQGYLLGVTSRGFETDDRSGPSYAAWLVGGLNRKLEIPWPPGLYPQQVHLLEMDGCTLRIDGREHVTALDEHTVSYQLWFDR
ncbi:trypsin-like peptidase domain-containing protein [Phormidium tenue FACHB-886]|nr:trypsin-like peptidase domain-containing protein [Phormidium tenue FACHB-886]